jgi:outer membrane murein-binding lipoprotein Lpp
MTNEEFQHLVLKDLGELKTDVSDLKSDVSGLKSDVFTLKSDVSTLKSDVSTLNQKVENLEIKVVAGFTDVVTIFNATQKEVQSVRHDLRIIEAVTAKNWNAIIDLQKAE